MLVKLNKGKPDHGWDKRTTDIVLDPAVMLLLDLRDESSISHDILDVLGFRDSYDLDLAVAKMDHMLRNLVSSGGNKEWVQSTKEFSQCADDLWQRLENKSNVQRLTRSLFRRMLREKMLGIFDSKLNIFVNRTFGPNQVMRVDLSFLPDEFFCNDRLKDTRACIEKGKTPATRMTGGLHFCPVTDSEGFSFSEQERFTSFLRSLMKQIMVRYGHAQSNHVFCWQLGFLWTAPGAREQDPHVDYEHDAMAKYLKRRSNVCLPYSMDLPLQRDGMKLNYYGPQELLYEEPLLIECPFKQCVVWRGDAVHGGGHCDLNGGGGFRVHAYLHMNAGGRPGMSNTVHAIIDWRDSSHLQARYSAYLKTSTGQPFPKGND